MIKRLLQGLTAKTYDWLAPKFPIIQSWFSGANLLESGTNSPENPDNYIDYSRNLFLDVPMYQKAIEIRQSYLSTFVLNTNLPANSKKGKQVQGFIDYIMNELEIRDRGCLFPKCLGINNLLNLCSQESDKLGYLVGQWVISDPETMKMHFEVSKATDFVFSRNDKGQSEMYRLGEKEKIDIGSIIVFRYGSVLGYESGTPLIYGGGKAMKKWLKNMESQDTAWGLNTAPADLTAFSIDKEATLGGEKDPSRKAFNEGMTGIREKTADAIAASAKGIPTHTVITVENIKEIISLNTRQKIHTIPLDELKWYGELAFTAFNVPLPLLIDSTGAMNSDKHKEAHKQMVVFSKRKLQPAMYPSFKKLVEVGAALKGISLDKGDLVLSYEPIDTENSNNAAT